MRVESVSQKSSQCLPVLLVPELAIAVEEIVQAWLQTLQNSNNALLFILFEDTKCRVRAKPRQLRAKSGGKALNDSQASVAMPIFKSVNTNEIRHL